MADSSIRGIFPFPMMILKERNILDILKYNNKKYFLNNHSRFKLYMIYIFNCLTLYNSILTFES